jgi:8-oxo-(d)GTP phosphatase
MIIFINDIPVTILKLTEAPGEGKVNHTVDASTDAVTQAKLIHNVWIKNAAEKDVDSLLAILDSRVPTNVLSVFISVSNYPVIKKYLLDKFKVLKASGGLVRKKDKVLMIYRMKKWDLPKGKKEKGEKYKQTAVREVEEECNVTIKLGKKICTTWHTYTMNKRAMIKKTRWYAMDVVDDSKMRPQADEDIEETRWMSRKEVYHALEHSYKSISYVFERFYALAEVKAKN